MARYRKIDVRIHGDEKFRRLSPPQPCGRYLWFFLLTAKRSTSIPGLFEAGEAALAEELEWSLEGFRKAFAELVREGIAKADWKARLVWLPNAIKHNPPENPNVVKSWESHWDELPECTLKTEAFQGLMRSLQTIGKGLSEPFAKGCGKGMANQEQEQEQEQGADAPAGPDEPPLSTIRPPSVPPPAPSRIAPKPTRTAKPKGERFVPEDFVPTEAHAAKAKELGLSLERELWAFKSYEFKQPKTDWSRAFFGWLGRSAGYGTRSGPGPVDYGAQKRTREEQELEAALKRTERFWGPMQEEAS